MEVLDSRELCARIGALIARSAPRVEYYAADIKRFKRSFSRQDVAVFRQAGYPVGDMELFYVIQRFCDDVGLTDMVSDAYMRELYAAARKLSAAKFRENPYIQSVRVPTAAVGNFCLRTSFYRRGEILLWDMPDLAAEPVVPKLGFFTEDVVFPSIYEGDTPWMSVCPSEIFSMEASVAQAHGRVLVLGLGLGYYPFMIAEKETVTSITIVERQPEVVRLFRDHLLGQFPHGDKIRIVTADALEYMDTVSPDMYDFCFADIWENHVDGAEAYVRLKPHERRLPHTEFAYWIEDPIRWYLEENM